MSLLLAYEDRYCFELDRAVRRVIRRDGDLPVVRERYPVEGVTNFPSFVSAHWRRFRDHGGPTRGMAKPRALLCIADADAVAKLGITARARPYREWIPQAEEQFTKLLRSKTDRPEQVHGSLLRWNLESTMIAAYDEPEAMQRLAGGVDPFDEEGLGAFLSGCKPDPRTVDDADFTDTFEDSQHCLADLARSMRWRKLKKGDRRKDDALTWMTEHRLDKLVRRVPDLDRIAQRVRQIALAL